MFGVSRKGKKDGEADKEEALIVEGTFDSGEEYGTGDERKSLEQLTSQIEDVLEKIEAEFDGHEAGEGAFTLYMYGNSADEMFAKLEDLLRRFPFDQFEITKRYGPSNDSKAKETKFTL